MKKSAKQEAASRNGISRKQKPKQQHLPGLEPPNIPAINRLADDYVEARDARMAMLKQEIERQTLLQLKMKEHCLDNYEYDGKTVCVESATKVKVKRKAEETSDDE